MRQGYIPLHSLAFVLICLLALPFTSNAQLVKVWEHDLTSYGTFQLDFCDYDDDGNIFIGYTNSGLNVIKIDTVGTILYDVRYSTAERFHRILAAGDGGAYLLATGWDTLSSLTHIRVVKFDANGNCDWSDILEAHSFSVFESGEKSSLVDINGNLWLAFSRASDSPCEYEGGGELVSAVITRHTLTGGRTTVMDYRPDGMLDGAVPIQMATDSEGYVHAHIFSIEYCAQSSCDEYYDYCFTTLGEEADHKRLDIVRRFNNAGALVDEAVYDWAYMTYYGSTFYKQLQFFGGRDQNVATVLSREYIIGDTACLYESEISYNGWSRIMNVMVSDAKSDEFGNLYMRAHECFWDKSAGVGSGRAPGDGLYKLNGSGGGQIWMIPNANAPDYIGNGYMYRTHGYHSKADLDGNVEWVAGTTGILLWVDSDENHYFVHPYEHTVTRYHEGLDLAVVDGLGDPMIDTEFDIYKVINDPPTFTDTLLGTIMTDSDGRIELTPGDTTDWEIVVEGLTHGLTNGDMLKLTKHVYSAPAVKHSSTLGTMYSIHLDNAKFDASGTMFYYELGGDDGWTIVMDHTELRYNLLVSIEWDASIEYWNQIDDNFRAMSNYLYDVTDGQVRLDTVMIFDDADHWSQADLWITADNVEHPRMVGRPPGIVNPGMSLILMPRMWYGREDHCRNLTESLHPLNLTSFSQDFRTKAHEFGHYALGFQDEYWFWDPVDGVYKEEDPTLRCNPRHLFNYGFMDRQYLSAGANASEMSNKYGYQLEACQNTTQFHMRGMSCWDYLENWVEASRWGADNVYVPILKPDHEDADERSNLTGDIFIGPNDDLSALDYNVGNRIVFTHPIESPALNIGHIHITAHHSGTSHIIDVKIKNQPSSSNPRTLEQGQTADNDQMWVIGANVLDCDIEAWCGPTQATVVRGRKSTQSATSPWLCGGVSIGGSSTERQYPAQASLAADDSLTIELTELAGDHPLLFTAAFSGEAAAPTILNIDPLPALPTVDLESSVAALRTFDEITVMGNGYQAPMADSLGETGTFTMRAVDDLAQPFFVPVDYVLVAKDSVSEPLTIVGAREGAEVWLDAANTDVTAAMLLSTSYPVPLTGLGTEAVKAGLTHAVSLYQSGPLTGNNQITINYQDTDLVFDGEVIGDESTLGIFKWDVSSEQWESLGGTVDTVLNSVQAKISEAGFYAAFTNQIITDVDDDGYGQALPYRFDLSQNYPNPFNPATTIEYSLPVRSRVTIEVFNVLGRKVRTLVSREESAGSYTIIWDGADASGNPVATGVYLYRFQAGDQVQTKKMLLLK